MNLSVARRELRLVAYSVRFYRARSGIAAAGLVGIVCAFLGLKEFSSPYLLGQAVFTVAAWVIFLIAGVSFGATADSVSSEKRAGTLGLLFLTHLKGPDVILGKLIAHTLGYVTALAALFPLLAIPILLGGITSAQLFRLSISVVNMLLFSAAAGMLASTLCVRDQIAQSKAVQIILLFAAILPGLAWFLRYTGCDPSICLVLDLLSPVFTLRGALGSLIGPQSSWFYLSAALVFLISCALLLLASLLVPFSWQEGGKKSFAARLAERLSSSKTIPARSSEGAALLDRNPFLWLLIRDPYLRRTLWISIASALGLTVLLDPILSLYWTRDGFALLVSGMLLFFLFAITKIAFGRVAVSHISAAKESGILQTILASHVGIEDIVTAQFRALLKLLAWPAAAVSILAIATLLYSLATIDTIANTFTSPPEIQGYRFRALVIFAIAILFLFFDAITLTWAGVLCAFKTSRPSKAHSWTGFLALALPNVLYLAAVVTLVQFQSIRPWFEAFYPPLILWMVLRFANNILVILYARRWLQRAARQTATAPVEHIRETAFFPRSATLIEFTKTIFRAEKTG